MRLLSAQRWSKPWPIRRASNSPNVLPVPYLVIGALRAADGFSAGFKYIGNVALNLVEEGYEVPFGYEEAIGYMFDSDIRDKDGVHASVVFAQLVESLQLEKKTVKSHLDDLYKRYTS